MINQYNPQRFTINNHGHKIGCSPVGTLFRVHEGNMRSCKLNSYIVTAWRNREYFPCNIGDRRQVVYMKGGHIAECRNLANGRTRLLADWIVSSDYPILLKSNGLDDQSRRHCAITPVV